MAGKKRVTHLDMKFLDEIDGWRGFIASVPGVEFDGIDHIEGKEGPEIVGGYGLDKDGNRKHYSSEMRSDIEAIVAATATPFRKEEAA